MPCILAYCITCLHAIIRLRPCRGLASRLILQLASVKCATSPMFPKNKPKLKNRVNHAPFWRSITTTRILNSTAITLKSDICSLYVLIINVHITLLHLHFAVMFIALTSKALLSHSCVEQQGELKANSQYVGYVSKQTRNLARSLAIRFTNNRRALSPPITLTTLNSSGENQTKEYGPRRANSMSCID